MRSGPAAPKRGGDRAAINAVSQDYWPAPATMPATSPAAWQHESRNTSGRLARTAGAQPVFRLLIDRNAPAEHCSTGAAGARSIAAEQTGGRAPVVEVSAEGTPEAVRLHVGDRDSRLHVKRPARNRRRLSSSSIDAVEIGPSAAGGASAKGDVRREAEPFALSLVHRRKHATERVKKVGPVDQMVVDPFNTGPRQLIAVGLACERLENLSAPVLPDDAVILSQRDDFAARPFGGPRAQLEHRRAGEPNPREEFRSGVLCSRPAPLRARHRR